MLLAPTFLIRLFTELESEARGVRVDVYPTGGRTGVGAPSDFLGVRIVGTPIDIRGFIARGVEIEFVEAASISLVDLIGVPVGVGITSTAFAASRFLVNSVAVTPTYFDARDPSVNVAGWSVVDDARD